MGIRVNRLLTELNIGLSTLENILNALGYKEQDEYTDSEKDLNNQRFGYGKIQAVRGMKAVLARMNQTGPYVPAEEKCHANHQLS